LVAPTARLGREYEAVRVARRGQERPAAVSKAFAPLADGVTSAVQRGGDGLVGRAVVGGGTEEKAAAEGPGVGRGPGVGQGFQWVMYLG
jgi:hypothetical protein